MQPRIIEVPKMKGELAGMYIDGTGTIFIRDVKDKPVLIHECVHFLWDKKDSRLRDMLKGQGLDYDSTVEEVLNNEIFNSIYECGGLKGYDPESYLNESIAYIICCSDDHLIRKVNSELLNSILDNDFFYHDEKGVVYHADLDEPLTVNNEIEEIIMYLKMEGVI